MFKALATIEITQKYQLEYYNSIGLLFPNHLFLHQDDRFLEFDIAEIKSIFFKRELDLRINYRFFVISVFLLALGYLLPDNLLSIRLLNFVPAILFLLLAVFRKNYSYKIMLYTHHSHYFTIPVNETYKEEACELLSLTKTKIKKNKSYLKVS